MKAAESSGTERRHHQLYVTRNTEYHLKDGRVIAVRDRAQRCWLKSHKALGLYVQGLIRGDSMVPRPGEPRVGDRMYLANEEVNGPLDLVTSMVLAIERPPAEVVAEYASIAA
jgi:hypothetical protein